MKFNLIDTQQNDRIHMAKTDELIFKNVPNENQSGRMKPQGLWYAMGKSWLKWLEDEDMSPSFWGNHLFKIEINPAKILFVNTTEKVDKFIRKYRNEHRSILWEKVAEDYSGIEFNPYFRNHRSIEAGCSFYYCVDVPSGCIWREDGIRKIERITN